MDSGRGRQDQLNYHCTVTVFLDEAFVFEGDILRTAVSVGISYLCTAEPSLHLTFSCLTHGCLYNKCLLYVGLSE